MGGESMSSAAISLTVLRYRLATKPRYPDAAFKVPVFGIIVSGERRDERAIHDMTRQGFLNALRDGIAWSGGTKGILEIPWLAGLCGFECLARIGECVNKARLTRPLAGQGADKVKTWLSE